jgi:hypothetical protein
MPSGPFSKRSDPLRRNEPTTDQTAAVRSANNLVIIFVTTPMHTLRKPLLEGSKANSAVRRQSIFRPGFNTLHVRVPAVEELQGQTLFARTLAISP